MSSAFAFRLSLLWLCALCLTASAQTNGAQKQAPDEKSNSQAASTYQQLVERIKKGDQTVDFVKLRDAYAAWDIEAGDKANEPNWDLMVEAFKKEDYARAVGLAEVALDYQFINRGLHLATENAYRKLGNEAKANFHRDIAEKLLKALLSTGDGKSYETAYRVLSINEEYLIMHELGYEVHSQALAMKGARAYDILSGTDKKTGKAVEVYFFLQGGL